ncbi:hypothetical protein [Nocardia donostiensis]|nr:hypothetical protein [Nocardia donostiensis]
MAVPIGQPIVSIGMSGGLTASIGTNCRYQVQVLTNDDADPVVLSDGAGGRFVPNNVTAEPVGPNYKVFTTWWPANTGDLVVTASQSGQVVSTEPIKVGPGIDLMGAGCIVLR